MPSRKFNTSVYTLEDMTRIMGDTDPARTIWITTEPDNPRQAQKTPYETGTALRKYRNARVNRVAPYIHDDGEFAGNIYCLDPRTMNGKDPDEIPFLENPEFIPLDAPTWRIGDPAWIIQDAPGEKPIEGRVSSISYPTKLNRSARITFTQCGADGRENPNAIAYVPVRALFKCADDARSALRNKDLRGTNAPDSESFQVTVTYMPGRLSLQSATFGKPSVVQPKSWTEAEKLILEYIGHVRKKRS